MTFISTHPLLLIRTFIHHSVSNLPIVCREYLKLSYYFDFQQHYLLLIILCCRQSQAYQPTIMTFIMFHSKSQENIS